MAQRSSILDEARTITHLPDFTGFITDLSAPTANMYGYECPVKLRKGPCLDKSCIYPEVSFSSPVDHSKQTDLMRKIRQIKGVKKSCRVRITL